jgi:hypothetical protein
VPDGYVVEIRLPMEFQVKSFNYDLKTNKLTIIPKFKNERSSMLIGYLVLIYDKIRQGVWELKMSPRNKRPILTDLQTTASEDTDDSSGK